MSGAPLAIAQAIDAEPASTRIESTTTPMVSTTSSMVSHRDQRHSWQTADGAVHIVVNVGTVSSGNSLTLYSSFDGGVTWLQELTLPNTDADSTADGIIGSPGPSGTVLQLVYGTEQSSGNIIYATANYDSSAQSWTLTSTQTAFSSPTVLGSEPSFTVDSAGDLWCGFTALNSATGEYQIQMLYQAAGTLNWMNTGLVFAITGTVPQHAPRPVPLNNGVGMIFQAGKKLFWTYRLGDSAITSPWTRSVLYTGLPNLQSGSDDTAYSVVADAAGNLYLVFVGDAGIYHMTYVADTGVWGAVQALTSGNEVARYTKASIAGGNVIMTAQNGGSLMVFQSTDGGVTFNLTQTLVHPTPPPGSTLSYGNARIDAPAYASGPLPTWQQFSYGSTWGLLFFQVPVVN